MSKNRQKATMLFALGSLIPYMHNDDVPGRTYARKSNTNAPASDFHFISYNHISPFNDGSEKRSFVTTNNPSDIELLLHKTLGEGTTQISVVPLNETQYRNAKRAAYAAYELTGKPKNDGFVCNFGNEYKHLLAERDMKVE